MLNSFKADLRINEPPGPLPPKITLVSASTGLLTLKEADDLMSCRSEQIAIQGPGHHLSNSAAISSYWRCYSCSFPDAATIALLQYLGLLHTLVSSRRSK